MEIRGRRVIRNSILPIIRMVETDENGMRNLLGTIKLGNMIPVPDNMIERVIISDISDMKYRSLLNDQYKALLSDWNNIQNTANKLYNLYMTADEHLSAYELTVKSRCCNFELLEQKCKEFHLQNENSNIE